MGCSTSKAVKPEKPNVTSVELTENLRMLGGADVKSVAPEKPNVTSVELTENLRMLGGADVKSVAPTGNRKFGGLAALGDKLYLSPWDTDKLLEFDPATGAIRGYDVTTLARTHSKFGCPVALGGKLYAAPCGSDQLLEFDPATGAVRGYDVTAVASGPHKFWGIVAFGGKLYAAPLCSDKLLEFDPATGAIRGYDVRAVARCSHKFVGMVALGDKLYAAPNNSDKLLEFDPATCAIRGYDVTALARGDGKFAGIAALGGKLYAAPCNSDKVLQFDPATGAIRAYDVTAVARGGGKFQGIAALGGKLYSAPASPCCYTLLELLDMDACPPPDFASGWPIALQRSILEVYKDVFDYRVRRVEGQVRAAEEQLRAAEQMPAHEQQLRAATEQVAQQKAALQDLHVQCQKREDMVKLSHAIDRGECCQFYFVDADYIRSDTTKNSREWTLRGLKEEGLVKLMTISLHSAFAGDLVDQLLSVSHRWESPSCADQSGKQFESIRDYVLKNPKVKYVWVDWWCLPQGKRTSKEQEFFKATLPHVNLLYLSTSVLILLDLSYLSRFWTQFEAWLSLQTCTSEGLAHRSDQQRRATIMRLHNAPPSFEGTLFEMWSNKTPAQAHEILAQPDVTVTNQSDKEVQLKKIEKLDELVRTVAAAKDHAP